MIGQLVVKTVAEAAGLIATEELAIPSAHTAKPIQETWISAKNLSSGKE